MPDKPDGDITGLLAAVRNGEADADARLMEATYRELRKIAAGHMRRERSEWAGQIADGLEAREAVRHIIVQSGRAKWESRILPDSPTRRKPIASGR